MDLELPAAQPPSRFVLRPGGRRAFGALGAFAIAFAILGLISSLGASVLHGTPHTDSHLVVGLAAFLMFGSAAAAQLLLGSLPLPRLLTVGAVVFPVGLVLCAVALCRQLAATLGLELVPAKVEGVRSKAKRLAARGWLAEERPGLFSVPVGRGGGS
ncbi:hypothetical protein ACFS5L_02735 [Streptomyces phyllanthi]|uniref:hypothetical protein n=1 Tax=Streptomyces phyllanthi TaxID=1803180 RepID=UPI002AD3BA43|nr:hypothetical protein [Streptomyces phyllanthi]